PKLGTCCGSSVVRSVSAFFCLLLQTLGPLNLSFKFLSTIRASSGFWSILVLSLFGGCVCWLVSWTLTHLHTHQPRMAFPTAASLTGFRDVSGHAVCMDYGMAFLNGVMGMLTVVWCLS
uniref:Uncharacterized protein n=1 Tax=Oryzias latipes TaxID=8090 RepID=A0A3P9MAZ3_ORYLA